MTPIKFLVNLANDYFVKNNYTIHTIIFRLSSSLIIILQFYMLYTETIEHSLENEADLNFVIPERKKYYIFKKGENMK